MNQREVEDVIIQLLAEDNGFEPVEYRNRLVAEGEHMPVDSLLVVEVLARVETRFGVKLPNSPDMSRAMGSVSAFARAIIDLQPPTEMPATEGETA